jgi:tripartite-type tricarboxylate transporter receptor subunit TctC
VQRRIFLSALAAAAPCASAFAQLGAGKPIRIIVPLSPGSPSDAVTRIIAPRLAALLVQTVIIDNKPGANGLIAIQDLMRAAPDGATLLMGSVSFLGINVALIRNLPYDPRRDLTPVAGVYSNNHAWCIRADLPVRSVAELIAYAKTRPGQVSAGVGSTLVQVQLLAFERHAGVEFLKVPYKSVGTNITDVIGGTLDLGLFDMGTAIAQAREGKLRVIGTSPLKRHPLTPDWPAISETLPGYDIASWSALVGPASMPAATVSRISDAVATALQSSEIVESLAKTGSVPLMLNPTQLRSHIDAEVTKFVTIARDSKLEPQ